MDQGQRSQWSRSYKNPKQRQVGSQQCQVASLLSMHSSFVTQWFLFWCGNCLLSIATLITLCEWISLHHCQTLVYSPEGKTENLSKSLWISRITSRKMFHIFWKCLVSIFIVSILLLFTSWSMKHFSWSNSAKPQWHLRFLDLHRNSTSAINNAHYFQLWCICRQMLAFGNPTTLVLDFRIDCIFSRTKFLLWPEA